MHTIIRMRPNLPIREEKHVSLNSCLEFDFFIVILAYPKERDGKPNKLYNYTKYKINNTQITEIYPNPQSGTVWVLQRVHKSPEVLAFF